MIKGNLYKRVVVEHIHEETRGFKVFVLRPEEEITYKPGQYLTLVHYDTTGTEIRRSYSILSAPGLPEPLSIGIKRQENGYFSRLLIDHTRQGDVLTTTGTGGFFILPDSVEHYRKVFFFAAGSGITPILSLIKTLLHFHPAIQVVLVYSNAAPATTAFLHLIQALMKNYPQFTCEFLFSNHPDLRRARLNRELLEELLHQYAAGDFRKALHYVCGPESYIRMCTYILRELGVPAEQVKKENFWTPPAVPSSLPPDKSNHTAFINIAGHTTVVEVRYPDSILKAARKQQLALPYSCEAGRCGNCVARCTAGRVWHAYNEVLTEKELAAGWILTCAAHPIEGDVYLSFE